MISLCTKSPYLQRWKLVQLSVIRLNASMLMALPSKLTHTTSSSSSAVFLTWVLSSHTWTAGSCQPCHHPSTSKSSSWHSGIVPERTRTTHSPFSRSLISGSEQLSRAGDQLSVKFDASETCYLKYKCKLLVNRDHVERKVPKYG